MRRFPPDPIDARGSRRNVAALDAASDHELPSAADTFVRLGLLLVIALCFGLAAQFLVGATY